MLVVGIVGVLIPGLQPQLLGALAVEGRLSVAALGSLASVELLAMGIAAGAAGFVLSICRLRTTAIAALIAAGSLDILTPHLGAGGIFVARIGAGIAEGVLIWLMIGLIVRADRPERWSGIYLATQTLAQLALASGIGLVGAGSDGGFTTLGIVTLAALVAVRWMPAAYPALAAADDRGGMIPARGALALAGIVLYLAFVVAVWVYVEPLAAQRGLPPRAIHLIAPLSLAMQVLGAGAATIVAGRLPRSATIVIVGIANLGLLGVMGATSSALWFVAATAAFGFLWLFVLPFQVPAVVAADPTRRAAVLIGGAQLIGSSLGPFAAGLLIAEADVAPILWFGAAGLVGGVIALVAAGSGRHGDDA